MPLPSSDSPSTVVGPLEEPVNGNPPEPAATDVVVSPAAATVVVVDEPSVPTVVDVPGTVVVVAPVVVVTGAVVVVVLGIVVVVDDVVEVDVVVGVVDVVVEVDVVEVEVDVVEVEVVVGGAVVVVVVVVVGGSVVVVVVGGSVVVVVVGGSVVVVVVGGSVVVVDVVVDVEDVLVDVVACGVSGRVMSKNTWSAVALVLFVDTRILQFLKSVNPLVGPNGGSFGDRQLNRDCGLSPLNGVNACAPDASKVAVPAPLAIAGAGALPWSQLNNGSQFLSEGATPSHCSRNTWALGVNPVATTVKGSGFPAPSPETANGDVDGCVIEVNATATPLNPTNTPTRVAPRTTRRRPCPRMTIMSFRWDLELVPSLVDQARARSRPSPQS